MNRILLLCLGTLLVVSACGGDDPSTGADEAASGSSSPEAVPMPEGPLCAGADMDAVTEALGRGKVKIARDVKSGAHAYGKTGPRLEGPMCEMYAGQTSASFVVEPAPKGLAGLRKASRAGSEGLSAAGATCTAPRAQQLSGHQGLLKTCDYKGSTIAEQTVLVGGWSLVCAAFQMPGKQAATDAVTGMCEVMVEHLSA